MRQHIIDTPITTDHLSIHLHPFKTLPLFKSHIHPKFVIFNAGAKLVDLATADVSKLVKDFPGLSSIITLYNAWIRKLADNELNDLLFNDDHDDDYFSDQSPRSYFKKRKAPARRTKFRKRSKLGVGPTRKVLSELTLSTYSQLSGEAQAWTNDRIHEWAKDTR